jgi:hypothetical protein
MLQGTGKGDEESLNQFVDREIYPPVLFAFFNCPPLGTAAALIYA